MAFWNVDLTTEDGALGAAQIGSYACFVAAALTGIGLVAIVAVGPSMATPLVAAIVLAEIAVYFVVALRLRVGKGVVWGVLAMIVLVAETLGGLFLTVSVVSAVVNAILLAGVVTGLRGARALQTRRYVDADD